MLKDADKYGIPRQWLADHPLFGDEAADQQLYARADGNRQQDPVAYDHRIDDLVDFEKKIAERLIRLITAKTEVEAVRLSAVPAFGETVLTQEDDPAVSLAQAQEVDKQLAASLAGKSTVEDVEKLAAKAIALYRRKRATVANT
jgi:hypothetical protein